MPVGFLPVIPRTVEAVASLLGRVGLRPDPATTEMWRAYTSLVDPEAREAFVHTLRAVVDHRGQRVSATDKLYLAEDLPTLIVWGGADPVIPVAHAHDAARALPGSHLEVMEGCGHFPYAEEPQRFVQILRRFVEATEPAWVTAEDLADRLAADAAP